MAEKKLQFFSSLIFLVSHDINE